MKPSYIYLSLCPLNSFDNFSLHVSRTYCAKFKKNTIDQKKNSKAEMKSERKTSTYYLDVFQILCHKLVHSKCHVSIFWSAFLKPIIFSLYFLFNFIQFQKKMTPWMQNRKKKPLPILAKIKCTFTTFSTSQSTCMHIQAIWLLFFF